MVIKLPHDTAALFQNTFLGNPEPTYEKSGYAEAAMLRDLPSGERSSCSHTLRLGSTHVREQSLR